MTPDETTSDLALFEQQIMGRWTADAAAAAPANQSLWKLVNDRLSGRWTWMLAVGAGLAALLAVLGYRSTEITYQSQGAIRVAPHLPTVLESIPETREMPYYNQFVHTQVQYILGRRVLENALEDQQLKTLPWVRQDNVLKALEEGLDAVSDRRSELIFVAFEATDPRVARVVCNAVIESYDEIHGREGGNETSIKLQRLYDLKAQLVRDLKAVRAEIREINARYLTTDLNELRMIRARQLEDVEQKIAAAQIALQRRESREVDLATGLVEDPGPTMIELEAIDPHLAELRRFRDSSRTEFERIRTRHRPGTGTYSKFQEAADTAERLFQEQYRKALGLWETRGVDAIPGALVEGYFGRLSAPRLREEIGTLSSRAAALRQECEQLVLDVQHLSDREFDAEGVQNELDRVNQRIDDLEREGGSIASRISVVQPATMPHSPHRDGRLRRAAAGLLLGFLLSLGGFFLLGTLDRRTYAAEQLRDDPSSASSRCLGVLPDLGRSLSDPESNEVASHCVHQIRNQIEVTRDQRPGYALAVSSPFQGDGKSSIVMALGWSYAAAGYRTILIDCDMVGRSLSRQLGLIGREGLKESLVHRRVDGRITDLPVDNLSVLPVGIDPRFGPETVRQSDLRSIFDQLREQFEMIIIDTGPLLGSLESTPVTATADGVVLSLRRGRSRARLDECVRRLEASHGRMLGVILNCVGRAECARYVSEASLGLTDLGRPPEEFTGEELSVIHAANGERNVLMQAMESSTSRHQQAESEEAP